MFDVIARSTIVFGVVLGLVLPGVGQAQDEALRLSTPSEPIPYADQWLQI